jgi:hypothetical protein
VVDGSANIKSMENCNSTWLFLYVPCFITIESNFKIVIQSNV